MGLLISSGALSRCTAPIWGECVQKVAYYCPTTNVHEMSIPIIIIQNITDLNI